MRIIDMRRALPLVVIVLSSAVAAAQSPSPSPAARPAGPTAGAASPGNSPPYAAENERYVRDLQRAIKGKEDLPAKEVFKNTLMLGDVPAARLLRTMESFTRTLGVSCSKCHVPDHWESEDKDDKEVTRDMMKMTRAINEEYLKKMKLLEDDNPSVNCFTCHRGQARPSTDTRPAGAPSR